MIAQTMGNSVVAMCLNQHSPLSGQYTRQRMTCDQWKSGHHGAVDDPPNCGEESRAAYAAEEGISAMNEATAETVQISENDGWEWAIVEVYGHRKHCGRIREEERFGTKMLRVDVPTYTPEPTLFDAADRKLVPPKIEWVTHYYGGQAIFSLTPTDEASVMRANKPYERPSRFRLPAPYEEPDDDNEYEDDR